PRVAGDELLARVVDCLERGLEPDEQEPLLASFEAPGRGAFPLRHVLRLEERLAVAGESVARPRQHLREGDGAAAERIDGHVAGGRDTCRSVEAAEGLELLPRVLAAGRPRRDFQLYEEVVCDLPRRRQGNGERPFESRG